MSLNNYTGLKFKSILFIFYIINFFNNKTFISFFNITKFNNSNDQIG